MSEVRERYQVISSGFTSRLDGVPADRWADPTPCTEWTTRDLVDHVIRTHRRVLAMVENTTSVEDPPDEDLPAQWLAATDAVLAVLSDETRASKIVSGRMGEQPFESLVGRLLCTDTLVHTWDLARATGQDERLDPDAVSKAAEAMMSLDEGIRGPGGFAAKILPEPNVDEQTRFLNFCGRAG